MISSLYIHDGCGGCCICCGSGYCIISGYDIGVSSGICNFNYDSAIESLKSITVFCFLPLHEICHLLLGIVLVVMVVVVMGILVIIFALI